MPQRIKPTDVTAAYRAAVVSARAAGVDTEGWNLRMQGSNFMIVTREEHGGYGIVPGTGVYMGGYFASSYREAWDALHAMRRAWDMVPSVRDGIEGNWPCWHVDASNGMTYGVAANGAVAAKIMVNRRLHKEWLEDHGDYDHEPRATKAVKVDEWSTAYGTVLCYGATQ